MFFEFGHKNTAVITDHGKTDDVRNCDYGGPLPELQRAVLQGMGNLVWTVSIQCTSRDCDIIENPC